MSSPWNTIAAPEAKFLKDIMSEELKQNSQRRQKYPVTPHKVERECCIGDEKLAKSLQEECTVGTYKSSLIRDKSCKFKDNDEETCWEKFDPVLREFDPIPLHNCKSQPNIHNRKYNNMIDSVDPEAKLILKEMINEKVFDKAEGLISKGKRATILHVSKTQLMHYIVKVFKTSQAPDIKSAQNEKDYLLRLNRASIPCPTVISLRKHVLVLSLIGKNKPAPSIADVHLVGFHARIAYTLVIEYMKTLYNECNLIHANLSEKKVLWYKDYCHFIDLSCAVELFEEGALDLLFNDCVNIFKFFTKLNVPDLSPEELFKYITGCDFTDEVALVKLKEDIKTRKNLNIAS